VSPPGAAREQTREGLHDVREQGERPGRDREEPPPRPTRGEAEAP
jgi:hypothetical protein